MKAPLPPPGEHTMRYPGRVAEVYFAGTVMLIAFLASGLSAHLITVIGALGGGGSQEMGTESVLPAAAVAAGVPLAAVIAALRGVGQSSARLVEVMFLGRIDPTTIHTCALALMATAFALSLFPLGWSGATQFSLLLGAGLGLTSITRGTVPLQLFAPEVYASRVGVLLVPSFLSAALAPISYAAAIDAHGVRGGLLLSVGVGVAALLMALRLRVLVEGPRMALSSHVI